MDNNSRQVEQQVFNNPPDVDVDSNIQNDVPEQAEVPYVEPEVNNNEPEEELEEEDYQQEEEEPKKGKTLTLAEKNRLQRERFRALNVAQKMQEEANYLRQENERLRQTAEEAFEASTYHYGNSLDLKLNEIKEMKRAAKELGDADKEIALDEEMARVVWEKQESNRLKAQHERYLQERAFQAQQNQQQQSYQQQGRIDRTEAQRFLIENSWANENSGDFDPELVDVAESIAQTLSQRLEQSGQAHRINSAEYLNAISQEVRNYSLSKQSAQPRRPLNMRSPNVPVAPPRHGSSRNVSAKRSDGLTEEQRELAKSWGLDPKAFKKALDKDIKLNGNTLRVNSNIRGGQ